MNNFKNLKELYQALLDGKTINDVRGAVFKMLDSDNVELTTSEGATRIVRLSSISIVDPSDWSIYQEPERWFRVTSFYCKNTNPFLHGALYRSKEDFLSQTNSEERDYKWIKLEEFCA